MAHDRTLFPQRDLSTAQPRLVLGRHVGGSGESSLSLSLSLSLYSHIFLVGTQIRHFNPVKGVADVLVDLDPVNGTAEGLSRRGSGQRRRGGGLPRLDLVNDVTEETGSGSGRRRRAQARWVPVPCPALRRHP